MNLPNIPISTEVSIKLDKQSILMLALSLACVVAFGILLSKATNR